MRKERVVLGDAMRCHPRLSCFFLIVGTLAGGCTPSIRIVSSDENLLRIGDRPVGYPKTFIQKDGPNCTRVTEDWHSMGKGVWVKNSHEETTPCPSS